MGSRASWAYSNTDGRGHVAVYKSSVCSLSKGKASGWEPLGFAEPRCRTCTDALKKTINPRSGAREINGTSWVVFRNSTIKVRHLAVGEYTLCGVDMGSLYVKYHSALPGNCKTCNICVKVATGLLSYDPKKPKIFQRIVDSCTHGMYAIREGKNRFIIKSKYKPTRHFMRDENGKRVGAHFKISQPFEKILLPDGYLENLEPWEIKELSF